MHLPQLTRLAATEVDAALATLPPTLRDLARAIPVHYEALPPQSLVDEGFEPDILGLFDGSPHGSEFHEDQPMPPQISLFLENLWDFADRDLAVFREEVRITFLHELGHYFGWDEDDLSARELD